MGKPDERPARGFASLADAVVYAAGCPTEDEARAAHARGCFCGRPSNPKTWPPMCDHHARRI